MIGPADLNRLREFLNVKKIVQGLVVVLALMVLVFVSALITLKLMTWGETVEVPDIRRLELAAVVNQLGESGLEVNVERQEHHPIVPANAVLSQDPPPGSRVKKGRVVSVIVSLGSEEVKVPNLMGEAFKRAQILLGQAGLVLGDVARVSSAQPRNAVIAQYPAEGAILQKGAKVDLLVCNGTKPLSFVAPDLSGATVRQAEELSIPMALRLVFGGKGSSVVSQNPAPGLRITAGSALYVTLGNN